MQGGRGAWLSALRVVVIEAPVGVDVAVSAGAIGREAVIGRDCGVDDAGAVLAATGGGGASTIRVRVEVEVRPVRSITTGPSARCPCVALSA